MNPKQTLLVLLLCLALGTANAQSIIIQNIDGSETTELLSAVENLTFTSTVMKLNTTSLTSSYTISDVQKIYFDSVPTVSVPESVIGELLVYPNPVNNQLQVRFNNESTHKLYIYRIDGVLVYQDAIYSDDQAIDVSYLSKGLYLIRIDNQVVRFEKL